MNQLAGGMQEAIGGGLGQQVVVMNVPGEEVRCPQPKPSRQHSSHGSESHRCRMGDLKYSASLSKSTRLRHQIDRIRAFPKIGPSATTSLSIRGSSQPSQVLLLRFPDQRFGAGDTIHLSRGIGSDIAIREITAYCALIALCNLPETA